MQDDTLQFNFKIVRKCKSKVFLKIYSAYADMDNHPFPVNFLMCQPSH